jgi:kynurenine formamidase
MKTIRYVMLITLCFSITTTGIVFGGSYKPQSKTRQPLTKADIDRMMTELSNWGRWGKDDQLGAINLITPAKRKQAAAIVKEGVPVSLAHDVEKERAADNSNPFQHTMILAGQYSLDSYSVNYHGYAHTHLDALCHVFYQGKMYNGFSQQEVTQKGADKLSIRNLKEGIFTRGILMDIPRLKGVAYLEPETPIYPEDLDAWEKKAGIKVSAGDVIFIRTGRWARRKAVGPWDVGRHAAGLHASCAKWLKDRGVAILGSDVASDVVPSQIEGVALPIHLLVLVAMGVNIFDNCDLEAVSEAAAKRNRWEFLLTAAPLAVPGGTGSPLNPIAMF